MSSRSVTSAGESSPAPQRINTGGELIRYRRNHPDSKPETQLSERCLATYRNYVARHHNGGEWGIRTPEGVNPTRFPSVRHRPLGEFSTAAKSGLGYLTRDRAVVPTTPCAGPVRRHGFGLYNGCWLLAWRHPGQIPQDGNVARVTGLWRVREGSLLSEAQNRLEALLLRRLLWQVRALPAAADRPRTAVLVA